MARTEAKWIGVRLTFLLFIITATGLIPLLWSGSRDNEGVPSVASWLTYSAITVPHTIHDHIYYSAYDGKSVYTNQGSTRGANGRSPLQLERTMFKKVKDEVLAYLKSQGNHDFRKLGCNDLRFRDVPSAGVEVEVICSGQQATYLERVTLFIPQASSIVTFHTSTSKSEPINIIMPLQGRPEALKLFLAKLKQVMSTGDLNIGLTVIYFQDEHTEVNRRAVESASGSFGLQVQFLLLEQKRFSRSKALKLGVERTTLRGNIVFLCDVDVLFTRGFFDRCLTTPVQGRQVFFPMVFSQYNPELVYTLHGKKIPTPLDSLDISDYTGFWRLWGHGMVCLYKTDFLRINGFNPRRTGWGGEDIHFLEKTTKMKYKIIRSLDPGLIHHYHPKDCKDVAKGQQWPCKRLQALGEASGIDYGLWYFRNEYNTSMWGVLREEDEWKGKVQKEWAHVTQQEEGGEEGQAGAKEREKVASEGVKFAQEGEKFTQEGVRDQPADGRERETDVRQREANLHELLERHSRDVGTLRTALFLAVTLNIVLSVCLCCRHLLPTRIRRWI